VWLDFDWMYFNLPWTKEEVAVAEAALERYADGLRLIEGATRKSGAQWRIDYAAAPGRQHPPRGEGGRGASILLLGDALLAHQVAGDDRRALARVGQELRLAEILDEQRLLMAHGRAVGTAELGPRIVEEIVPDLRVGGAGVSVAEVRGVIDLLLDETAMRRGAVRALACERRSNVNFMTDFWQGGQDVFEGWAGGFGTKPLRMYAAELGARADTAVMRGFERSVDWESFRGAVDLAPLVREAAGWRAVFVRGLTADHDARPVQWHYQVSAERRMAAVALAVRCYAGVIRPPENRTLGGGARYDGK
jgi:hypothetical protein